MVVLPLLSLVATGWPFGFASAPYDMAWARRYPKRAGLMALAGPAANLVLVLIAVALIRLGIMAEFFYAPPQVSFGKLVGTDLGQLWPAAARMVGILFSLNLLLCIFNLLPFPPLDGAGALPLVLSPNATRRYQDVVWGNPVLSLIGIFIAWQLFPRIFEPIFFGAVRLIYPGHGIPLSSPAAPAAAPRRSHSSSLPSSSMSWPWASSSRCCPNWSKTSWVGIPAEPRRSTVSSAACGR